MASGVFGSHSSFAAAWRQRWEAVVRPFRRSEPRLGAGASDTRTLIRPSEIGVDRVLCGAVLMLVGFGMVMVFSSGAVFAAKKYGDSTYFLKR